MFDTLYKIDTTGKIRQWSIKCGVENGVPYYEVEHGVKDGALVSSRTEVPVGKSPGRANETTPEEQCALEAESLWKKHKNRKGYTDLVSVGMKWSPMLAKSYNKPGTDLFDLKDGRHINYPCYFQPKLDGIRCIARRLLLAGLPVGEMVSRQNKVFSSLPHIARSIRGMTFLTPTMRLDGELYVHGEEFQNLTSAIKRDEPSTDSAKVQYHVYDVIDSANPDWKYKDRKKWLRANIKPGFRNIRPVHTGNINTTRDVERELKAQIGRGYEGIMLRNIDGLYKVGGRSADLQKVKLFIDEEFVIVGATENKGKMKNQCTFLCKTKDGYIFGVKPEGDEALRRKYWDDWKKGGLDGKLLTVRFFAWTTSEKPVPRFPVGVTIRDYE